MTDIVLNGIANEDGQSTDHGDVGHGSGDCPADDGHESGDCPADDGADGASDGGETERGRGGERPAESEPVVTDGGAVAGAFDDPGELCDRDSVNAAERTFVHDEADHCESGAAGRAIVGVTNERGEVLLWVHEAGDAILPNVVVDPDEDWAAAARGDVAETAGIEITLDGVERVREVTHERVADGRADEPDAGGATDEPDASDAESSEHSHLETTHHVVFAASPARPASERDEPTIDACDDVWSAGWYDHLPVDPDDERSVVADVRLFLD